MSGPLYGIYGASGLGREILPVARELLTVQGVAAKHLVFIDDTPSAALINGHPVMTLAAFLKTPASSRHAALAIANSQVREQLAHMLVEVSVAPFAVSASNVVVMDDVQLGEGALLSPFVTLTSNIRIGRFFQANLYSYVAHDCVIGDFVTFAPAVKCNGNVVIEDHAYIGTGAIIKQGQPGRPLVIGRGAIIGMGAVVTKDVAPGVTVVGNPARPIAGV
jgi:sugar O-acyltransferase (sialic acid O-acetyltransferase NeuD family)